MRINQSLGSRIVRFPPPHVTSKNGNFESITNINMDAEPDRLLRKVPLQKPVRAATQSIKKPSQPRFPGFPAFLPQSRYGTLRPWKPAEYSRFPSPNAEITSGEGLLICGLCCLFYTGSSLARGCMSFLSNNKQSQAAYSLAYFL